jgi:membrane protease YdiL (CAAX protease family)
MSYSRLQLLILAIIAEGFILVLALVLAAIFHIDMHWSTQNFFAGLPAGIAGTIGPLLFFMLSLSKKVDPIPVIGSLRQTVIKDVKKLFDNSGLADIALISLLAGIAEEMLFRGVIQAAIGMIGASILFGLAHFITRAYMVIALCMGLYLGFFFEITGNLFVPIQIHVFYDFGALIYLKYFVHYETENEP